MNNPAWFLSLLWSLHKQIFSDYQFLRPDSDTSQIQQLFS